MSDSTLRRTDLRLRGLALLVVVGLLFWLTIAMYQQAFKTTVDITLEADRSGLQMQAGNLVKMRNVDVGRVSDVALGPDGNTAVLTLAMEPGLVQQIPGNPEINLFQLTAFGNKYVSMSDPAQPAGSLGAGQVLRADHVSAEANEVLASLERVVTTVQPAKLASTLGALSEALRGQGDRLGQTLDTSSSYLAKINNDLPTLQRDLQLTGEVADIYGDVAPDLMNILRNVTVTGNTVVEKQQQLNQTLVQLTTLGDTVGDTLAVNGDGIVTMLDTLRPTTSLLARYSPMFTCWIQGVDEAYKRLRAPVGGSVGGAATYTTVQPGDDPYSAAEPSEVSADSGPDCHGLPFIGPEEIPRPADKNDPTADLDATDNRLQTGDPTLITQLFGPLSGTGPGPLDALVGAPDPADDAPAPGTDDDPADAPAQEGGR
ncbi:MCE-family protein Mce1A [Pseudonocardia sp. Ae168_Ps1]|uniref:MCE family protein n=1 Tax=unclassified Pseudonocardia TaxID=2619320 RepID=UPI00094AC8B9|nr:MULTISPECIES: MCE family protein [unclassified Pseudonocardia]OLL73471.1 MCE-family protein Mce1A [Pseudonocardia sp. Ae150A_Ps1]OLL79447.1 MCE-family protein Mce1A [Pseudonocardia sp. Ae168_Ps1]OLL86418.1 MCE-family protein Mce1A [Pseudonocardia sp. Ae263_Ps1]OLL93541.1 MCE-family protein Mce1A [Pseudonocardia sp. Ae356_Ps1]